MRAKALSFVPVPVFLQIVSLLKSYPIGAEVSFLLARPPQSALQASQLSLANLNAAADAGLVNSVNMGAGTSTNSRPAPAQSVTSAASSASVQLPPPSPAQPVLSNTATGNAAQYGYMQMQQQHQASGANAVLVGAPTTPAPTVPAPALRRGPSRSTQDLREAAAALSLVPSPALVPADASDNLNLPAQRSLGGPLPLSLPRSPNVPTSCTLLYSLIALLLF